MHSGACSHSRRPFALAAGETVPAMDVGIGLSLLCISWERRPVCFQLLYVMNTFTRVRAFVLLSAWKHEKR